MSTKSPQLKTRCTLEFKKEVEDFAKSHNYSTSTLIRSSLQTCMKAINSSSNISEKNLLHELSLNLVKNTVMNTINLDCNIPEHTRQKIEKELSKIV